MATTFNVLDLIFFSFTFIFVLTAFLRGFVKEIFALLNWVLALTLSYLLAPYVSKFFARHYENKMVIDIVVRSVIFILVFFISAISTSGLSDELKDKMPKVFDRSLGVLYGFVKTLLIFGFIYALYFNLYGFLLGNKLKDTDAAKEAPIWLKQAKCYSLIKFSGDTLDPIVKKFFNAMSKNLDNVVPKNLLDEKIDDMIEEKTSEEIYLDEAAPAKIEKDAGYNKKDIEKMNRLIEIVQ